MVAQARLDGASTEKTASDQFIVGSFLFGRTVRAAVFWPIEVEGEATRAWGSARRVTVEDFRTDPLFPRIERAVAAVLANGKVVTPIDMLIQMDLVRPEDVKNWRFGRIPYLESVMRCNLTKLGRLLRILRMHAHDLNLVPSTTAYVRRGKRGHRAQHQFSKTGDATVEEAYSRHFVWPGKGPFHPSSNKESPS